MTTTQITWTKSLGSGRFTEINGYKVVELLGTRKIAPVYVVEPLGVDGLPIRKAKAGGTVKTLGDALALTERPFCPGCGSTVVAGYTYDAALACPGR